jgi:SAM-dependent methyltransferase
MHEGMKLLTAKGKVVDVGAGNVRHEYHDFIKQDNTFLESIDGRANDIDFEKDTLPYSDNTVDTVISCNALEHVYNHRFLISEMVRILTPNGSFIGFVPFLIKYHPDPHDYFRYTNEALRRLFEDAGLKDIAIYQVGGGPFLANFNNIIQSMPHVFRLMLYPFYAVADTLFLFLHSKARDMFPLGYVFSAKK